MENIQIPIGAKRSLNEVENCKIIKTDRTLEAKISAVIRKQDGHSYIIQSLYLNLDLKLNPKKDLKYVLINV